MVRGRKGLYRLSMVQCYKGMKSTGKVLHSSVRVSVECSSATLVVCWYGKVRFGNAWLCSGYVKFCVGRYGWALVRLGLVLFHVVRYCTG
jgi:hypothetical protein